MSAKSDSVNEGENGKIAERKSWDTYTTRARILDKTYKIQNYSQFFRVNHMQPEGTFCQSCGMPLNKPEDHGTEANGSQSKKYCAYCYQTGEFREPERTLDEMIEISAKGFSDQDPDVSLEQARTQMKQILPHLERWRAREIQF